MNDGCHSCGAEDKSLCGIMLCRECRDKWRNQGKLIKKLEVEKWHLKFRARFAEESDKNVSKAYCKLFMEHEKLKKELNNLKLTTTEGD